MATGAATVASYASTVSLTINPHLTLSGVGPFLGHFPITEPPAVGDYSIDFADNLPPDITLGSPVSWALAVRHAFPDYTVDPSPSSRLIGGQLVTGSVTTQRIAGLYAGNIYLVTVTGTMSDGEVVELWCTLTCVPAA